MKSEYKVIDGRFKVGLADYDDIPAIMKFIEDNWTPNYIMARDREYFEFEFVEGRDVHFVLSEDIETGSICGILGYMPCSKNKDRLDVFGSIWIVTEEDNLGIAMDEYLREITACKHRVGVGLNRKTAVPMVRFYIGDKIDTLKQYSLLNDKMDSFKLAVVPEGAAIEGVSDSGYSMRQISDFSEVSALYDIDANDKIPYKDSSYYEKKFFNNPRREYVTYGIYDPDGVTKAFIVTRICEYDGARAFRIVDYFGDFSYIKGMGYPVYRYIVDNGMEYADFYCFGITPEFFDGSGFVLRDKKDGWIIPNRFEPFQQIDKAIWVRYKDDRTVFFKADGDQDRAKDMPGR
ncbi:MAG: hypothetical protein IK123_06135 [Lachnospiraceae bacterium]|nr:hypothetical protein [Lachnospiraceae bacterium]